MVVFLRYPADIHVLLRGRRGILEESPRQICRRTHCTISCRRITCIHRKLMWEDWVSIVALLDLVQLFYANQRRDRHFTILNVIASRFPSWWFEELVLPVMMILWLRNISTRESCYGRQRMLRHLLVLLNYGLTGAHHVSIGWPVVLLTWQNESLAIRFYLRLVKLEACRASLYALRSLGRCLLHLFSVAARLLLYTLGYDISRSESL